MASQFSTQVRAVWQAVHNPGAGLTFPEAVSRLLSIGVTRYHVDYVAKTVTAYSDGADPKVDVAPAPDLQFVDKAYEWNLAQVEESIRGAVNVSYAEFSRGVIQGGVVNYWAYLIGKRVVYCGALGDLHVQWFPGVQPPPKKD